MATATAETRAPVVETTNHPVETHLGNSLDGTSQSNHNTNDASGENPNGLVDTLVFSDEEASECSRFH